MTLLDRRIGMALAKYKAGVKYSVFFSQTPKAAHYYYEKGGETQRLHLNRGIASNLRENQNSEVLNYAEFPEDADVRPPGGSLLSLEAKKNLTMNHH
jgi:hypothetical protein